MKGLVILHSIGVNSFIFEKTNISDEAQREDLPKQLWRLSKDLINTKI